MKTIFTLGFRFVKVAVLAAGLFVVASPAFALAISNKAGVDVTYKFTKCSGSYSGTASAGQQTPICDSNEDTKCQGTCSYTISAQNVTSCTGTINAGSGLQVDSGLKCSSF